MKRLPNPAGFSRIGTCSGVRITTPCSIDYALHWSGGTFAAEIPGRQECRPSYFDAAPSLSLSRFSTNKYVTIDTKSTIATPIFTLYGTVFDENCENEPSINPAQTSIIAVAQSMRHTGVNASRTADARVKLPGISTARPKRSPAAPAKIIDGNSSAP